MQFKFTLCQCTWIISNYFSCGTKGLMMPSKGTKYYIRCIEMAKGGCIPKTRYMIYSTKNPSNGPWLWCSWQSGRFRHQRSVVRIPTSAMINLYSNVIICQLQPRKDKNKEKEAGKGPFKKKNHSNGLQWKESYFLTLNRCHIFSKFHEVDLAWVLAWVWNNWNHKTLAVAQWLS